MGLADSLGYGQPQSCAARSAATRSICPVKPLEQMREMLRGDPFPFVADGDTRPAVGRGRDRDSDVAPGWGMPDSVVEQDHQQLVEAVTVAGDLDAARRLQLENLT